MKTLAERIANGEAAIAQARAEGRDVSDWEAHLSELKKAVLVQHLPPQAWVIEEITDPATGTPRAVKLFSAPLESHLWVLHDRDFYPPDDDPVFFEDELAALGTKTIDELKAVLRVKNTFPRCRVVQ